MSTRKRRDPRAPIEVLGQTGRINMRIDERFEFSLDFACVVDGKTLKGLVAEALERHVKTIALANGKTWEDFYDESRAVRDIKLAMDRDFPHTAALERRRAFIEAHAPFFFDDKRRQHISLARAEAIWPKIEKLVALWVETRATDYWAAGEEMAKTLKAARLAAPEWGEDVEL